MKKAMIITAILAIGAVVYGATVTPMSYDAGPKPGGSPVYPG